MIQIMKHILFFSLLLTSLQAFAACEKSFETNIELKYEVVPLTVATIVSGDLVDKVNRYSQYKKGSLSFFDPHLSYGFYKDPMVMFKKANNGVCTEVRSVPFLISSKPELLITSDVLKGNSRCVYETISKAERKINDKYLSVLNGFKSKLSSVGKDLTSKVEFNNVDSAMFWIERRQLELLSSLEAEFDVEIKGVYSEFSEFDVLNEIDKTSSCYNEAVSIIAKIKLKD